MLINQKVLMSDALHFDNAAAINPYMGGVIDSKAAQKEHDSIRQALTEAGVEVIIVPSPAGCQDGVYTANWALIRGDNAVMSCLPDARKAEEPYVKQVLAGLGKNIVTIPDGLHFSGQGDALPCGDYLFCGSMYRTDLRAHQFLADTLGFNVISLQTIPQLDNQGQAVINASSGWPDSFFYDIDLALSVIKEDLIAWCPEAFMPESQEKLRALPIDKIEVSQEEAMKAFACNLVSTGETVVMSAGAPQFKSALEARGLKTITPEITELAKGGGYIRCTTLTL